MGKLKDWAVKNSPFLKLEVGETIEAVYLGFKEVDDNRNPGETKIRYRFEINQDEKWFESKAAAIAMTLDKCPEGGVVRIEKILVEGKNRYKVEIKGEELPDEEEEES